MTLEITRELTSNSIKYSRLYVMESSSFFLVALLFQAIISETTWCETSEETSKRRYFITDADWYKQLKKPQWMSCKYFQPNVLET